MFSAGYCEKNIGNQDRTQTRKLMKAAVDAFENAVPLRTRIESTAQAAAEKIAQRISLVITKLPDSIIETTCSTSRQSRNQTAYLFHRRGAEFAEFG